MSFKNNFLNMIYVSLIIVVSLIICNSIWAAWYYSAILGRLSSGSMISIWIPTLLGVFIWLLILVFSFLKKKVTFLIGLIYSPFFLSSIFVEFMQIEKWQLIQFYMINQILAILNLLAALFIFFGLLISIKQYYQSRKNKFHFKNECH